MASVVQPVGPASVPGERFFLRSAFLIAALIVLGFSTQLVAGRSSFASPLRVHAHAVVFMGWVVIYLSQNILAATGRTALHRQLGWIAAIWMIPMVVLGFVVTLGMVRGGTTPFFFRPMHFLTFDPVAVLTFAGLTIAAIVQRRRTDWHRRLHFCGMTVLLSPAFGRLLPMPLLIPWAWEAAFFVSMLFPIAGMVADARRSGRVHPAWMWGVGTLLASFVLVEVVTFSPVGLAIYRSVTAGTPGAVKPPLAYPTPPVGPRITGRS